MIHGQTEVMEMIANKRPLPDILHKLVKVVEAQFTDKRCSILLADEAGESLRIGAAPSVPDEYNRLIDGLKIGPASGACGTAAYLKQVVIVPDILLEPSCRPWWGAATQYGLRSCWSFPVVSSTDRLLGTFAIYSGQPYTPEKDEVKIIEILAFLLGAIIERYQGDQEIERLAYYDMLTALPNRRFLIRSLKQVLEDAEKQQTKAAVLFIDLDRFKPINDTFGHEMGDRVLQTVSKRLKECIPREILLCRMDGDEFAVLVPRIERLEEVRLLCERILQVLEEPLYYSGHLFHLSASIGISLYPEHDREAEGLIQQADIAMYQVKSRGKKGYGLYDRTMSEKIYNNFMMISDFNRSLREDEFVLHYQPRYHTGSNRIQCVEALVRWNHPQKGLIPPLEFIPLAEETGFIIPLGRWVLEAACRQNKAWQKQGLPPVRMAVNCSARQLQQDDFIPTIMEVIGRTGLDSKWLEIEITESALMRSEHANISKLKELRSLGVHISIDDFGTGYSSLNYLMQFDVHALKIDKRFVQQIPNGIIANTIISLCRNLGLDVIAEGVETAEQLEYLRKYGCDEVQGYLFSKPVPAYRFEMLLGENETEVTLKA